MNRPAKRIVTALLLAAAGAGAAYVFRPRPLAVDTALVVQGPMQVTIDDDGQTRAHDRFTVAAPVTGFLSRITLHEGDQVRRNTVLATIQPLPLDVREETEIRARISAAESAEREAAQFVARAQAAYEQANREFVRAHSLFRTGDVSRQHHEQAQSKKEMSGKELEAAKEHAASAAAETARTRAGLISSETRRGEQSRISSIRAPFDTRILRILERSERVVTAGTPIVMLSNPSRLEIVADVLSTDAVRLEPGAPVLVEKWGGPQPLRARVRTIEPFGFTKVSALGVEEQRVNVIADFIDPPGKLGDGYHLEVRIVVWESMSVTKVPASAVFRLGSQWNVLVNENGVARQRAVAVGHRNPLEVEILSGLKSGEEVVLHPSNDLREGVRLKRLSPEQ